MGGKSSDIGAGVEVLANLICPSLIDIDRFNARSFTTVIALAFLTTSERSGDLILTLVMILDRGAIGGPYWAQFGTPGRHYIDLHHAKTLVYALPNQKQIKSNKSGL